MPLGDAPTMRDDDGREPGTAAFEPDALSDDAALGHVDVRSVRLSTLVTLRWLLIGLQALAVTLSQAFLGVTLPIAGCVLVIVLSLLFNLAVGLMAPRGRRLRESEALLTLTFDLAQLSALLFLTGGLANPFALFLLAPVSIAASVMTQRIAFSLAAMSVAAATILAIWSAPLQWEDGAAIEPPPLYVAGNWAAITLGVAFQASFARRVAVEAFNMSAALTAAQVALAREQRISAIGALAAAAAHELGTPLATIKLVAGELKKELKDAPELAEDAALISEQAMRCRDILERLSAVRSPDDAQIRSAPISTVLAEAAGPHLDRRAEIVMRVDGVSIENVGAMQPKAPRRPEIIHGLRNLIQNAVDFAASTVWIDVETGDHDLAIAIGDDGGGFSPDILAQIGEPFATTRGKSEANPWEAYQGMGLGAFISKTLLERTGARVTFYNAKPRGSDAAVNIPPPESGQPTGAVVRVVWPSGALTPDQPPQGSMAG